MCISFICHLKKKLFSVRLLSVLHGHSFFSSPPQRPMTSDFKGFPIPDFIHYIYFPNSWDRASIFSFWMFSAKQGHYWYHFYNVFGMTRSLTWDWTRDVPALEASTIPLGYRGGGQLKHIVMRKMLFLLFDIILFWCFWKWRWPSIPPSITWLFLPTCTMYLFIQMQGTIILPALVPWQVVLDAGCMEI